ncbi:hypothetical protein HHI36_020624 [Cryptolaemus montrouzieri]|uniref:BRCA2 OB3 domain-containing protein n=1 Tax=Cryptolaemus montrouzieri TaxID=559131 RepID=A0ABD2NB75_9CUCU
MNSMCGEFDTVGIIIKIQIDEEKQHVWLTDLRKRLLLIRIDHGPRICSLLNRINEGEKVAVCNLVLRKNYEEYSLAMANFHSVITQNPQYVFLREELEKLESVDRTELDILMNESRIKVGNLEERTTANSTSDGENITNFSKVTSTDIVMSMINIDEVVSDMK